MTALCIHTTLRSTTLDLPELAPLVGRRIEVIVREESAVDWPSGYFETTAGALTDPTFLRPPQPELDERLSFDEP